MMQRMEKTKKLLKILLILCGFLLFFKGNTYPEIAFSTSKISKINFSDSTKLIIPIPTKGSFVENSSEKIIVEFKSLPLKLKASAKSSKTIQKSIKDEHQKFLAEILSFTPTANYKASNNLSLIYEYMRIFNGLALKVKDKNILKKIKSHSSVKKIYKDTYVKLNLHESARIIKANKVWTLKDKDGNLITGKGIKVAILDTGVDYNHPDLGGGFGLGKKVIGGHNFIAGNKNPMDDHGHGTHVAGIIAAKGAITGIAPDCKILAYKVLNKNGVGSVSAVIAAIDMASDPDGNPDTNDGADIISLSLGGPGNENDAISTAINNAVKSGIVCVVSAGNEGPDEASITSPGCAIYPITVGATTKSDLLAGYSSRGPTANYNIKPEIVAPGSNIRSTILNNGYTSWSGTSMAAPHVTGVCALLLQKFRNLTPFEVKSILCQSSVPLPYSPFQVGSGRVNAESAVNSELCITPSLISFGKISKTSSNWSKSVNLKIKNLTNSSLTYYLKTDDNSDFKVISNSTTISLLPHQTINFPITFNINPMNTKNGILSSKISLYSGTQTLRITACGVIEGGLKFKFSKSPIIVFIHNHDSKKYTYFYPSKEFTAMVKDGIYDIITVFELDKIVVKQNIKVNGLTNINIADSEAKNKITIEFIDKNGNIIKLPRGGASISYAKNGMGLLFLNFPLNELWFSNFNQDYIFSFAVNYRQNNNLYSLKSNITSLSSSKLIRFDKASYNSYSVKIAQKAQSELLILPWQYFISQRKSSSFFCAYADTNHALKVSPSDNTFYNYISYTFPANHSFFSDQLIFYKYASDKQSIFDFVIYAKTPLRTLNNATINYFLFSTQPFELFKTEFNTLSYMVTPYFFSGQIYCEPNYLQVSTYKGTFTNIFEDISYSMPDTSTLNKFTYSLTQETQTATGQIISDLKIPIFSNSLPLKLCITSPEYSINEKTGISSFKLNVKNLTQINKAPWIKYFLISDEFSLTSTPNISKSDVHLKLSLENLNKIGLFLNPANTQDWYEIPLVYNGDSLEARLDTSLVLPDTFYNIRLVAESENSIIMTQEFSPAFFSKAENYFAKLKLISPPRVLDIDTPKNFNVNLTNTGRISFNSSGENPVKLKYQIEAPDARIIKEETLSLPCDMVYGNSVTLPVSITPPPDEGICFIKWSLIKENKFDFRNFGINAPVSKIKVKADYGVKYFYNFSKLKGETNSVLPVTLKIKNISSFIWKNRKGKNGMYLGYFVKNKKAQIINPPEFIHINQDVKLQESFNISVPVRLPSVPGDYLINFDLLRGGKTWFRWQGCELLKFPLEVLKPYNRSIEIDIPKKFKMEKEISANLKIKNIGARSLINVKPGYKIKLKNNNVIYTKIFNSPINIAPEETISMQVPVISPISGYLKIEFDLITDSGNWLREANIEIAEKDIEVEQTLLACELTSPIPEISTLAGNTFEISVNVKNTSEFPWRSNEDNYNIELGCIIYDDNTHQIIKKEFFKFNESLNINSSKKFNLKFKINKTGNYKFLFDILKNKYTWFRWQNNKPLIVKVKINALLQKPIIQSNNPSIIVKRSYNSPSFSITDILNYINSQIIRKVFKTIINLLP